MVFGMIYESNYHLKILEIDVLLYLVNIFLPFCFRVSYLISFNNKKIFFNHLLGFSSFLKSPIYLIIFFFPSFWVCLFCLLGF